MYSSVYKAKIATRKKRQRVLHQLLAQEAGITIEEVYNLYEEECAKLNEYAGMFYNMQSRTIKKRK
jgi:hypothetical protein